MGACSCGENGCQCVSACVCVCVCVCMCAHLCVNGIDKCGSVVSRKHPSPCLSD